VIDTKEGNKMRTFDKTMITPEDVHKRLRIHLDNHRFFLRDTSPGKSQGNSFDLTEQVKELVDYHQDNGSVAFTDWVWCDVKKIASSKTTWMPNIKNETGALGSYSQTFNRSEIAVVLS
jgi:hypothetical protein